MCAMNEDSDSAEIPVSDASTITVSRLAPGLPISGDQLAAILADFRDIAARTPVREALVMHSVYLTLLLRFLRDFRQERRTPWDGAPEVNVGGLVAFRRMMRGGDEPWDWLRGIARKPIPSPKLRRGVLKFAKASRGVISRGDSKFTGEMRGMWGYFAGIMQGGSAAGPSADAWEFFRVPLISEIDGWKSSPPGNLRFAQHMFILRAAIALADAEGEIAKAWDETQARYADQSRYVEGLTRYPKLLSLLEGLFQRTEFPHSIAGDG